MNQTQAQMTGPRPYDGLIVSTPGVRGGKPRIDGHRICVQDVVMWKNHLGMTLDEILEGYEGMTPAKIDAAMAYYEDHREQIDGLLKAERDFADRIDAEFGTFEERLSRITHAKDDPVPSGREL